MNTAATATADQRPEYVDHTIGATAGARAMIPACLVRPIGCIACGQFSEYDEKSTVLFEGVRKLRRIGYVCGATCATDLTNRIRHAVVFVHAAGTVKIKAVR